MEWCEDKADSPPARRARVLPVLGLLALTAITFSYLGAYAVYNALVSADVVPGFAPGHDPRPRWFCTSCCVLMSVFIVVGQLLRQLSRRDFRAIDEMADAAEQT